MKTYIPLFFLLLLAAISCDSYRNVSADDGVYYTDEDAHAIARQSSSASTPVYNFPSNDDIKQKNNSDYSTNNEGEGHYHINYNDSTYQKEQAYLTDNPDDLVRYADRGDRDVHVYIHYDNYWYWYRPRWYFRYYSPFAWSIYYYGPAYYVYYDPFWYDWDPFWDDPWCDSWYVVNYNYYGYPYNTYYGAYYGPGWGYPYGYPYVINYNYFDNNGWTRRTHVRGPRGGRPYDRISQIAGTRLASHIRQNVNGRIRHGAEGRIRREGLADGRAERMGRYNSGHHVRNGRDGRMTSRTGREANGRFREGRQNREIRGVRSGNERIRRNDRTPIRQGRMRHHNMRQGREIRYQPTRRASGSRRHYAPTRPAHTRATRSHTYRYSEISTERSTMSRSHSSAYHSRSWSYGSSLWSSDASRSASWGGGSGHSSHSFSHGGIRGGRR